MASTIRDNMLSIISIHALIQTHYLVVDSRVRLFETFNFGKMVVHTLRLVYIKHNTEGFSARHLSFVYTRQILFWS